MPQPPIRNRAVEQVCNSTLELEALQDVKSCLKFPINTSQAIQSLIPPPPPVPSEEANENAGAAENGDGSDPTTDAAKAVTVGAGAGLAVTGATAAGMIK